jgi:hypothetical protein
MSAGHGIDYETLIERLISDFRPVRRLWPAGARVACWLLFEATILLLIVALRGYGNLQGFSQEREQLIGIGLLLFASIAAAFLALKSAVPGREMTWPQMAILIVVLVAAFIYMPGGSASGVLESSSIVIAQLCGLAALPWLCLFWAVRRGVPLQPEVSGAVTGVAAFCTAAALWQLIHGPAPLPGIVLGLFCTVVIAFSALAGRRWLNWIGRWQREDIAAENSQDSWATFNLRSAFSLGLIASTAALILVVKSAGPLVGRVPEFDLAIKGYERALEGFHPNVPSISMEAVLTAYVEHGMPAYMWDFSAQGFKLVGGRWDPMPDGTPMTYTWFRGTQGAVMCIFKQTEGFNPPPIAHDEHHKLLFYRYRDFSFCLINVGGYGNFISVITAPMPLKQFERLVLTATL